jgi:hypothetical protein
MPVNVGFMVGPAIGTRITQVDLFAIFPAAAVFTALGLALLSLAYRQPMTTEVDLPTPDPGQLVGGSLRGHRLPDEAGSSLDSDSAPYSTP